MDGTASNGTIRLCSARPLLLSFECGEGALGPDSFPPLAAGAEFFVAAGDSATCAPNLHAVNTDVFPGAPGRAMGRSL